MKWTRNSRKRWPASQVKSPIESLSGNDFDGAEVKKQNVAPELHPETDKASPSLPCSLVATRTANMVAVPRTFPAIVRSASNTGGYCSAKPSSLVLTL